MMRNPGRFAGRAIVAAATIAALLAQAAPGQPADDRPALTIRLVHPDRQAAEILRFFEGARAPHPAAALAAWKRAAPDPTLLGKPLEALIAAFNPEMVAEWRVLHQAELTVDLNPADGKPRWHAVVPRDDGTVASGVTALRLSDGSGEEALDIDGRKVPVERLGTPRGVVAARAGVTVILASSRVELVRGLRSVLGRAGVASVSPALANSGGPLAARDDLGESAGAIFELDPGRLARAGGASLAVRRTGEFLNGLACRRVLGHVAIKGDAMALSVTTSLDQAKRFHSILEKPAAIDPAWLQWLPAASTIAVVSVALEPGPAFWDWAFAIADRVDRVDPARAEMAPLRTRVNLLAAAAGIRPEADLWPHLRGLTACLLADRKNPGRPAGGAVVLHIDAEDAANRLAGELLPRLARRYIGEKPPKAAPAGLPNRQVDPGPGAFVRLGALSSRSVYVAHRGRDVVIAWGDDVPSAIQLAADDPQRSVARLCTGWMSDQKPPPQRLAAFWPARCWQPAAALSPAAWNVLADDPPIVWWGWNEPDRATDSVRWPGLKNRVHRFLDAIPQDSPVNHQ